MLSGRMNPALLDLRACGANSLTPGCSVPRDAETQDSREHPQLPGAELEGGRAGQGRAERGDSQGHPAT